MLDKKQKFIKFKIDKGKYKIFKLYSEKDLALDKFDENLVIRKYDNDVMSTSSDIECGEEVVLTNLGKGIKYIKAHKIKFKSS